MYALVDCNNFYCSCERVFNPSLEHRPVIVLSNNDGCAISRSDEAKALGIEMGTPEFLVRDLVKTENMAVFSSNYALYGDMSNRVMSILTNFAPRLEIYSIDEAFLDLHDMPFTDLASLAKRIRKTIRQDLGIPVSIGIAPTKTLAKMANRFAKKQKKDIGIHLTVGPEAIVELLQMTSVSDIWGIGSQYQKLLKRNGFKTAHDLSKAPEEWMRKNLTVMGQRMVNELNGRPAIEWEAETPKKKNIAVARGFGKLLTEKHDIAEALANYTASCGEKLRAQHSIAQRIQVFVQTNGHRKQDSQYYRELTIQLPVATNNTGILLKQALRALDLIFKAGHNYQKCGIFVLDLIPEDHIQQNAFTPEETDHQKTVMKTMDALNKSLGKDLVRLATQGFEKRFKLRQAMLSKRYTTRLEETVLINI